MNDDGGMGRRVDIGEDMVETPVPHLPPPDDTPSVPEPAERPSPHAQWDEVHGRWMEWHEDDGRWIPLDPDAPPT